MIDSTFKMARVVPSRKFTAQFEGFHFARSISIHEKSGYAKKRAWAGELKKKLNLNTESDLQMSTRFSAPSSVARGSFFSLIKQC